MLSVVSLDVGTGRSWVSRSLSGSHLQVVGDAFAFESESFELVLPSSFSGTVVNDLATGIGVKCSAANLAMAEYLGDLVRFGGRTLIVEDEISLRGDPIQGGPVVYFGRKVLRFCPLDASGLVGVKLLLRCNPACVHRLSSSGARAVRLSSRHASNAAR